MKPMRRVAAMLLAVWISALLMLPAMLAGGQSRVPACCRAAGKHHCSLRHAASPESGPTLQTTQAACPLWQPDRATLPAHQATPINLAASVFDVALKPHAVAAAHSASLYNPSFSRSRQKRGPPVFFA